MELETIGLVLVGIGGLLLLMRLMVANVFWRACDREFFPEAVQQFLLFKEDGSELVFRQRGGDLRVWLRREAGRHDDAAVLRLTVPAAPWSSGAAGRLNERFRFRGFETHFDEAVGSTTLGEMRFEVPDIWADHAGEPAAWAVRCVVDALDVPADAEFIIDMKGIDSARLVAASREE